MMIDRAFDGVIVAIWMGLPVGKNAIFCNPLRSWYSRGRMGRGRGGREEGNGRKGKRPVLESKEQKRFSLGSNEVEKIVLEGRSRHELIANDTMGWMMSWYVWIFTARVDRREIGSTVEPRDRFRDRPLTRQDSVDKWIHSHE
jgi:hypothetical protein